MPESISLFNSLKNFEKIEVLVKYAQIVACRFEGDFKFMLYQLNDFYIELKYTTEGNIFVRLRTFKSTDLLGKYLSQINIQNILH